jgi:YidC/Oxa1 family membrane protein insertase
MQNKKDNLNIIIVAIISFVFLLLWRFFYEVPSQQKRLETPNKGDVKTEYIKTQEEKTNIVKPSYIPLSMVLKSTSVDRINCENQKIKGSINAIGLKIDNLELKNYKTEDGSTNLLYPS